MEKMSDPKSDMLCLPAPSNTAHPSTMTSLPVAGSLAVAWAARLALTHEQSSMDLDLYDQYGYSYKEDECYTGSRAHSFVPLSSERDRPPTASSARSPQLISSVAQSTQSHIYSVASTASVLALYPVSNLLREVSPGVLSDGSKTIHYPPVQQVLQEPELGRKHPLLADRVVEALVIIALMRQPHHDLHLHYWDGFQKDKMDAADRYNKTLKIWDGLGSYSLLNEIIFS
jgi:hypothetical protein